MTAGERLGARILMVLVLAFAMMVLQGIGEGLMLAGLPDWLAYALACIAVFSCLLLLARRTGVLAAVRTPEMKAVWAAMGVILVLFAALAAVVFILASSSARG